MVRKLVTVRRVSALAPILGADRIQSASVDGWNCVVGVDAFQPGDLGVYFEIDSLLPGSDPRWAFLAAKKSSSGAGAGASNDSEPATPADIRIKTMRIQKTLSQGLFMPLAKFPEISAVVEKLKAELGPGEFETELRSRSFEDVLGVVKFEKPSTASGGGGGGGGQQEGMFEFPAFVPKTDQARVQNLPGVFAEWGDAVFQETTKMDGSSMTIYFVRPDSPCFSTLPPLAEDHKHQHQHQHQLQPCGGRVGVCSRNRELAETNRSMPLFWSAAVAAGIPAALARCGRNLALQGELCGSSIQGNFEGFAKGTHAFYLYSVWDIDAQRYLPPREVHGEWAPRLGVNHVPVVGYRPLRDMGSSVADLVARADGKGINGRKREGIVLKHVDGEMSFKAISNSYLLKHGE